MCVSVYVCVSMYVCICVCVCKGGSRALGKGGTKNNRGDCTGYGANHRRRPVNTTPWASRGGGLEGGFPPPESEKK